RYLLSYLLFYLPSPDHTPALLDITPASPDYSPTSPDYSHATDTESNPSEDPSSDHIPPLPAILPFLSSGDDTTDSDTPDTPPSPTHGTPFTEITSSTQRSPVMPHRRVMILTPGQPIPHDDSAQGSSSDSSSEASSDFHLDASPDSSLRYSLSDHSSLDLPSTSTRLSRKRRRSPMTPVPALSHVSGASSPVRADLVPSPKRVRVFGYLADVKVDLRATSLRDDVIVRGSDEPHLEQDIDPEVQAEIECIAYADALRDKGIDVRVVVETVTRDERFHDHTVAIPVHRVQVIEGVQREKGRKIVGVESAVAALTERIAELERDNRRLRGTTSVEGQRVDRLQRGMSRDDDDEVVVMVMVAVVGDGVRDSGVVMMLLMDRWLR
nr:hypothetical protein [Tanacetum cinerariifolium]